MQWIAEFTKRIKREDGRSVDMYWIKQVEGADITLGIDVGKEGRLATQRTVDWIVHHLNAAERKDPSP